jgi:Rod binding domain-containing protein
MDALGMNTQMAAASLTAQQAQTLQAPKATGDNQAAAEQFEELLATMLVKEMRKSLPEGFFGKGPGSDSFNGWMDKSIGSNLAASWDLDIAGMVKTNLDSKMQRAGQSLGGGE